MERKSGQVWSTRTCENKRYQVRYTTHRRLTQSRPPRVKKTLIKKLCVFYLFQLHPVAWREKVTMALFTWTSMVDPRV